MRQLTLQELKEIIRSSAGVAEGVDLDGDIADIRFDELGYDSLAVLEFCGQVERRYGVQVSDEAVAQMPTPARAIEYFNVLLAKERT